MPIEEDPPAHSRGRRGFAAQFARTLAGSLYWPSAPQLEPDLVDQLEWLDQAGDGKYLQDVLFDPHVEDSKYGFIVTVPPFAYLQNAGALVAPASNTATVVGGTIGGGGATTGVAECCIISSAASAAPDGLASSGVYGLEDGAILSSGEGGRRAASLTWEASEGADGSGRPRPRPRSWPRLQPRSKAGVPLDMI
ncbi:UNVERIFIED_CONTAM: hypothetical protein Sindi_2892000 [Sesamum indicum]